MAQFEAALELDCTPETAFDFLIRPANVLLISPPEMGLSYADPPELLQAGLQFSFQLGGFGPVQHVTHEITEFDRPSRFVEMQIKGPLKHFQHEHLIEADGAGRIVLRDRIEFEPPGGLAGFIVTVDLIQESLKTGFDHRHQVLKNLLERTDA